MGRVRRTLLSALGGAVWGCFLGIFGGALAGCVGGLLWGSLSWGLAGAVLGGGLLALAGGLVGGFLGLTDRPSPRPDTPAPVRPPARPELAHVPADGEVMWN